MGFPNQSWPHVPTDWAVPHWSAEDRVHNWRNYISDELQAMWQTFTDEQKKAIALNAAQIADGEDWD